MPKLLALLILAALPAVGTPPALPRHDLRQAVQARQWVAEHDVRALVPTPEGLRIEIGGEDPYIHGPAADYPAGMPLWLHMRVRSDQAGNAQVFYFPAGSGATEPRSVHLPVQAGVWTEVKAPVPPLGQRYHLRFDPPGTRGACVLGAIWFTPRILLREPAWPKPATPALGNDPLTVRSGDVALSQSRTRFDSFTVSVGGRRMAASHGAPMAGYVRDGQIRWTRLATGKPRVSRQGPAIVVAATSRDADGATWTVTRRFAPGKLPGTIAATTSVWVSAPRSVVYLPMLTVMPGLGDAAFRRHQGLFAGLEYMDAPDRSSSEDDIVGPGALRRVPDTAKITFPLMAIQGNGRCVALTWRPQRDLCALFDSPDRVFRSGAHVMDLLFPGSDGANRPDDAMLPYDAGLVRPGRPVVAHATILGGDAQSIIPAIQQYAALAGWPPAPDTGMTPERYATWAAHGWLDSGIRVGDQFRHAYWPGLKGFGPSTGPDPCVWMRWLATRVPEPSLAQRLRQQAEATLANVPPEQYNAATLSHVWYPVGALVFGAVDAACERAREQARADLGRFAADGTLPYSAPAGKVDFGRTHFEKHANGFAAPVVASVLQNATLAGDRDLIAKGLRLLRALDRYDNTAPRGAQTWEVPLHTPDILASAHLVRAYLLGYEITGDRRLLDRAIYWAWTGVPFTYLAKPTPRPVGLYATTPVLGATNWEAPNWMGLPVQWCGLVYADALYRLGSIDTGGPWLRLADGITASGVQQSFPATEGKLQGLLPDSFSLRPQTRNAVAINPGTVQANAIRLYGGLEVYDFAALRDLDAFVHSPGGLHVIVQTADRAEFEVVGWSDRPYYVLVTGLRAEPRVRINGADTPLTDPHRFTAGGGRLVLRVEGRPTIELALPGR